MNIKDLAFRLLRNWWVVVLAALVTTGSTYLIGMQQDPIYQASSTVELKPSPALADSQMISIMNVISSRRTALNTYARKATSGTVKERVAEQLGVRLAVVRSANISASVLPETTLIEIRARANDPQLAADISNAVAQELLRSVPDKVMIFELVDYAAPPGSPVEPQPTRLLTTGVITGVVLGLLCALGLMLLQRFLETRAAAQPSAGKALAGSPSK